MYHKEKYKGEHKPMEVSLLEMLDARERRAARQRELLGQFGQTLVCFTMNIAGPVKNSPLIARGYCLGRRLLRQQLAAAGMPVVLRKPGRKPATRPFSWSPPRPWR